MVMVNNYKYIFQPIKRDQS